MRIFRPSLFVWLILGVFFLALLNVPATTNAQEEATETATPEPSATPSPTPIAHTLTIFRDLDTFTLYAPAQGEISLSRFTFAVSDKIYALESFSAFRGLPFSRLPTPICFRLTRSGANSPLPLDCASALILTQNLTNADVFWYDSVLAQDFVVLIQLDGSTQAICASGQSECDITFTPGEVTPTPTATITVTPIYTITPSATIPVVVNTPTPIAGVYPCDGTIVVSTSPGVGLNKVHVIAQRSSPNRPPVSQGSTVSVLGTQRASGITWYQISYNNNQGWLEAEYITLSSSCPS